MSVLSLIFGLGGSQRPRRWGALPYILLLVLALGAWLLYRGWTFYPLSLEERVEHPDYRALRPSGLWGNGYGYVGTILISTNLLYLARRKLAFLRGLGSMRAWLELHVGTGLLGALFVAFHSAFRVRTPIAMVTSASLAIVVTTGFVGRFLYAIAPQPAAADKERALASLDAIRAGLGRLIARVLDQHRPVRLGAETSIWRALATLPSWRRTRTLRDATVRAVVASEVDPRALDRRTRRLLRQAVRQIRKFARAEVRAEAAGSLLGVWRGLHRFFAILMLLTVAVHIGVAWHYGYRWIFSD